MSILAVLPIKTFPDAKHRLASDLLPGPRRVLAEAMFSDVLTALRRAKRIDDILVVTVDDSAQRIAGGHGAKLLDDRGDGHNPAADRGIAYAVEHGFDRVLLVPGDCPLLKPEDLDALIGHSVHEPSVLIVPDRHGTGTNALLLSPPDAIAPSFGEGSCARHRTDATRLGVDAEIVEIGSLALDIDTPEDLDALRTTLASTHGGAAHTRGMLSQLMRSRT